MINSSRLFSIPADIFLNSSRKNVEKQPFFKQKKLKKADFLFKKIKSSPKLPQVGPENLIPAKKIKSSPIGEILGVPSWPILDLQWPERAVLETEKCKKIWYPPQGAPPPNPQVTRVGRPLAPKKVTHFETKNFN